MAGLSLFVGAMMAIRRWSGLPMLWRTERRQAAD
jgi:hypothetical protein